MNDIQIKDNFLNQKEFTELQNLMGRPADFPWFYIDSTQERSVAEDFYFTHVFYNNHTPTAAIMTMAPILKLLHPISLWRIKANLQPRTYPLRLSPEVFHNDMEFLPEHKLKFWTTAIYCINTNNGYTEFEDGERVESVGNRMVTFPAKTKHRNTSCSDSKTRITINFNYFKIDYNEEEEY